MKTTKAFLIITTTFFLSAQTTHAVESKKNGFKRAIAPSWAIPNLEAIESVNTSTDEIRLIDKDKNLVANLKINDIPKVESKFEKTELINKKIIGSTLSPAKDKVFFGAANNDGIWLGAVSLISGDIHQISGLKYSRIIDVSTDKFIWSPDGKKIAIACYIGEAGSIIDVYDAKTETLFPSPETAKKYSKAILNASMDWEISDMKWGSESMEILFSISPSPWANQKNATNRKFKLNLLNGEVVEL